MQKAKVGLLVLLLFVLVRYAGVYHRAMDFNHYVQEEVSLTNSKGSLKEVLLLKAEQNQLPITDQNIDIYNERSRASRERRIPASPRPDSLPETSDVSFHRRPHRLTACFPLRKCRPFPDRGYENIAGAAGTPCI